MSGRRALESITIVGPTPPPFAGPEISMLHLLTSPLKNEFRLLHIKSNLKSRNEDKGTFSVVSVVKQFAIYYRILQSRLRGSRGLYSLLAVNNLGFMKDAGCIWLARLLGMRVISHMKGEMLPHFYGQSGRVMKSIIQSTLYQLDAMIVQADSIQEEISNTFGLPVSKLPIVPNMIDARSVVNTEEPVKTEHGATIAFLGHLSVGKGFFDLLEVLERVLPDFPDARFRCAGEPKLEGDHVAQLLKVPFDRSQVRQEFARLQGGQVRQIDYLGPIGPEEKDDLLRTSCIFVLPSYSESFPMSVLEAMSQGCAIVGTRVGAMPNMVENGREGLLVDPGDLPGLEAAIRSLLAQPEFHHRLGQAAQEKVGREYAMEMVSQRYADVFREFLTE